MFIAGLGTAVPSGCYSQTQCWEALRQSREFQRLTPRSRSIMRKVLTGANGISTRYLALEDLQEAFDLKADVLHERFVRTAPVLAASAAERALAEAGITPGDIDALLVSTCTGYLCPGLTSYVGQRLGLWPDVLGLDLVGQGCAAALPNLRTAEALLLSGQARHVLSICVEVCSAAFYLDDDPGVLISACLFGDGAGAAVLANAPGRNGRIRWLSCGSIMEPAHRDRLRFEQKEGMLRNVLSVEVPELAAEQAAMVFENELKLAGLDRSKVTGWAIHPGGRDVLSAIQSRLDLRQEDLRWSAAVLKRFGNLSSSSLFFVLQEALAESGSSGNWWMCSFGAGFSCHGALLEVS